MKNNESSKLLAVNPELYHKIENVLQSNGFNVEECIETVVQSFGLYEKESFVASLYKGSPATLDEDLILEIALDTCDITDNVNGDEVADIMLEEDEESSEESDSLIDNMQEFLSSPSAVGAWGESNSDAVQRYAEFATGDDSVWGTDSVVAYFQEYAYTKGIELKAGSNLEVLKYFAEQVINMEDYYAGSPQVLVNSDISLVNKTEVNINNETINSKTQEVIMNETKFNPAAEAGAAVNETVVPVAADMYGTDERKAIMETLEATRADRVEFSKNTKVDYLISGRESRVEFAVAGKEAKGVFFDPKTTLEKLAAKIGLQIDEATGKKSYTKLASNTEVARKEADDLIEKLTKAVTSNTEEFPMYVTDSLPSVKGVALTLSDGTTEYLTLDELKSTLLTKAVGILNTAGGEIQVSLNVVEPTVKSTDLSADGRSDASERKAYTNVSIKNKGAVKENEALVAYVATPDKANEAKVELAVPCDLAVKYKVMKTNEETGKLEPRTTTFRPKVVVTAHTPKEDATLGAKFQNSRSVKVMSLASTEDVNALIETLESAMAITDFDDLPAETKNQVVSVRESADRVAQEQAQGAL